MTRMVPRPEAAELRRKGRRQVMPLSVRSWYADDSLATGVAGTPKFRFELSVIVGFWSGA